MGNSRDLFDFWQSNDLESFKRALSGQCDTNEVCFDVDYRPIIHALAETKKPETEKFFICLLDAQVPPNIPHNGLCPIHRALKSNNIQILQLLLKNGVNVNTRDIYGNTPLHYCAKMKISKDGSEEEEEEECTKLLLQHSDIDVNAENNLKEVPLKIALDEGNIGFIRLVLENSKKIIIDEKPNQTSLREIILEKWGELKDLIDAIPVQWLRKEAEPKDSSENEFHTEEIEDSSRNNPDNKMERRPTDVSSNVVTEVVDADQIEKEGRETVKLKSHHKKRFPKICVDLRTNSGIHR